MSDIKVTRLLKVKYPNLLLVFLLLALLPYLLLSFYIHPVADDFIYFLKGEDFLKNLLRDYLTWNGRYFSNVVVFLNYVFVKHNVLYRLYPIILSILLIASLYWFLKVAFNKFDSNKGKLTLSLLFILLFFNLMPKLSEGLYWYTGSATYIFPCILLLLYLNGIVSYFKKRFFLNTFFHVSLTSALLFLLCGFNEVLTIVLLFFHLLFVALIRKRFLLVLLFICLVGFMVMLLAPGNNIRGLYFPDKHQFFHSLVYSTLQTVRFSSMWILSPAFLLASFIYLPMVKRQSYTLQVRSVILITALLSIVFFSAFAPYWSTGVLGQHRTINLACFLFLLSWFIMLPTLTKYIPQSFFEVVETKLFQTASIVLLLVSFFITRNGITCWSNLISGDAKQFHSELSNRESSLIRCKEQDAMDCQVPALTVFPKSIFVLDIQPQSSSWINIDYARYYGLNSVSIQQ